MRRRATALISILAATLVAACQLPDDTTAPEPPQTVLACQGKFVTGPQTIAGFDLSTFMQRTRLPSDVRIAAGRSAVSPGRPGLVDLYLDLCLPGTATMNDLLPVATGLAHDLKADELGSRTATLTIACVCAHLPSRTELRDEGFREHPWNGTPSREAEYLTWTRSDS
ncbi:hypothetical protein [Nocardia goodfellowii]|uniref:Lipoprotein n=1 Tax=Nocardia goodfellowii TaxID=882446 RepID=A0ABS4QDR9_9NOCA|nr:hypothetical protein [Nocardia goodfellowii]MBP2189829.1 hypothetical protein [Nocardia goodfellowii]